MKIKDLHPETDLSTVRVWIPKDTWNKSSLQKRYHNIKYQSVYLMGWAMGDFMIKLDNNSTRIYPMFWNTIPADIKEWEVDEKRQKSI